MERAGSHINRVKTLERIKLQKDSFNSLVFGTSDNVPIQELAAGHLVSAWRKVVHMSGTTAGSTENDKSKVLKRLLETKSNRFLLSKEEVLVGYIRSSERAFDERNR